VTGIIGRTGLRGVFFSQPGQLGFQVAHPPAKPVQLGGQPLVRPADMAEESLRHDGVPPTWVTDSMPSHAVAYQVHCLWRRDGEVHVVFIAAAPGFHGRGQE
jgi:hypothetical protein